MCNKNYLDDVYKTKRKEIERIFYGEGHYEKALRYTKDFFDLIKRKKASDYNFHFAHMMFSKIYNNMNQKEKAIAYAKISKKYLFNYRDISTLVVENKWQFAMCYKGNDNRKALAFFNDCFKISKNKKLYLHMSGLLEEIALMENDVNKMLESINIHKQAKNIDNVYRQNRLDDLYCSLFYIYMANNEEINAYCIIHNIENQSKVNNLKSTVKLKMSKLA